MTTARTRVAALHSLARSVGLSAGGAMVGRWLLGQLQPGGQRIWQRENHRGEPISLLSGPALAVGLLAGVGHERTDTALSCQHQRLGQTVAIAGSAVFGLIDDLGEKPGDRAKGLKGHLQELRQGRLTTGALKVFGIGASGGVAALLLTPRRESCAGYLADAAVNTVVIAGTANVFNLLDLRPGRALKTAAAVAALSSSLAPSTSGAALGASAALLRGDLAERDMLGDCGANALGAAIGAGFTSAGRRTRILLALGVVTLTMASERVSFSQVISENPVLHALDRLGRRP